MSVDSATADSIKLDMSEVTGLTNEEALYPGMKIATGVKLTAENTTGTDDYTVKFKLTGEIDTSDWSESQSKLKYTFYSADSEIKAPIKDCSREEDTKTANETHIWYTGCTTAEGLTKVGTGDVEINAGEKKSFTFEDTTLTIDTDAEGDLYYYLVVEYVNKTDEDDGDGDQTTTDAGKAITIKITGTTEEVATKKTA